MLASLTAIMNGDAAMVAKLASFLCGYGFCEAKRGRTPCMASHGERSAKHWAVGRDCKSQEEHASNIEREDAYRR